MYVIHAKNAAKLPNLTCSAIPSGINGIFGGKGGHEIDDSITGITAGAEEASAVVEVADLARCIDSFESIGIGPGIIAFLVGASTSSVRTNLSIIRFP